MQIGKGFMLEKLHYSVCYTINEPWHLGPYIPSLLMWHCYPFTSLQTIQEKTPAMETRLAVTW